MTLAYFDHNATTPVDDAVFEAMDVNPILARCAVRVSLGGSNTLS